MAWTNAGIKSLIDEYGTRIRSIRSTAFVISLYTPLQGQPQITTDDIEFVTIGGHDCLKVRRFNPGTGKYFYEMCTTEFIEKITIMEDEKDIIDPYLLSF